MNKLLSENKEGYIVYDSYCACAMSDGAAEKWFPTYKDATDYAVSCVKEMVTDFDDSIFRGEIIVYMAGRDFLEKSDRSIPRGKIVFEWKNI